MWEAPHTCRLAWRSHQYHGCVVYPSLLCPLLCAQVWQACLSQFLLVPSTQTATTTTVPPLETWCHHPPTPSPINPLFYPTLPSNQLQSSKSTLPCPYNIWYRPEMYHCVSSLHVGVMRFVLMFLYFCQQTVCEFLIEVLVLFLWRLVSTLHSRAHRCPGHLQLVKNFTSLQLYT